MDGNTSRIEEDEFIEALKEELPDVYQNIDKNLRDIADFQASLVQEHTTESVKA